MAQKYYNSAETAKILGKTVDDIKQMLERRELHGYRDGADWKFKAEDIDRLAKQSPAPTPASEEDDGDVLLSEVELGQSDPGLSGTVIGLNAGGRLAVDSDIHLAESDIALSALKEESTATAAKKTKGDAKGAKSNESAVSLDDDLTLGSSSVVIGGKSAGEDSSAVDLGGKGKGVDDDDLVLGGAGSDVSLGGDSGISLIDPSDSGFSLETPVNLGSATEESLELGEDDMLDSAKTPGKGAVELKTDDDFLLTPLEETVDMESSESGSQVIALDTEDSAAVAGSVAGVSMAAMLDEDLSAQPSLDMGVGGPLAGSSVLAAQPGMLTEGAMPIQPVAIMAEPPYTGWQIAGLAVCTALLLLCGMMMYDLLRSMWNFEQPNAITSSLMNTILGWIGL